MRALRCYIRDDMVVDRSAPPVPGEVLALAIPDGTEAQIWLRIMQELERAEKMHPEWPADVVHQTAIMVEEAGETLRAALNTEYHGKSVEYIRDEAIQTGAMVVRLLKNLSPRDR